MKYLGFLFLPVFAILIFSCRKEDLNLPGKDDITDPPVKKVRIKIPSSDRIFVPETVNSFSGHWCCANDGYLYGTDVREMTTVLRKHENGQEYEVRGDVRSVDPSYIIDFKMFSSSVPGTVFVLVRSGSDYSLLKSSDGAATFKKVYTFGEGNGPGGSNTPDVRILRGLLELKRDVPSGGGTGTLYLPEYNINKGRIPGLANDRVKIMKSEDNGDTWTKLVEWNTNGYNQVGHIHAMRQDPYTGEIYICIGDSDNRSGIIKWDGTTPWTDNTTISDIRRWAGFAVLAGLQRYRVCDVLFDEGYFYTFTDTQKPNNSNGSESGIWRGTKDFHSYRRVDNTLYDYDPMHIGWFGEKIRNTLIFTTSREYVDPVNSWKELNTRVYTSSNGTDWHVSGMIDWRDNAALNRYIFNVFTYNDRLYIDCVGGAGHSSTIQCVLAKKWRKYDDPVILHPVFFVGNWNAPGNDLNPGTNPDAPKLTLKSMLENRYMAAGSRIRISPGEFREQSIMPDWYNSFVPGRGSVVVEGGGIDTTQIISMPEGGKGSGMTLRSARTLSSQKWPFIIKDLAISMGYTGSQDRTNYLFDIEDTYLSAKSCRIGSSKNDLSPLVHLAGDGAGYISENSYHIANSGVGTLARIIEVSSPGTSLAMKNCILLNGYDAIDIRDDAAINLKNCTFYGTVRHGVTFSVACSVQPFIINCIFRCGSSPLNDISGMNESEIDYNLYNRANSGVEGGIHSMISVINPLAEGMADSDMNLKIRYPVHAHGHYLPDVPYDFIWRERHNPPTIGAYE